MSVAPSQVDLTAVKVKQQQTWASGDFSVVAARIVLVSEQLADSADLRAGSLVLDVDDRRGGVDQVLESLLGLDEGAPKLALFSRLRRAHVIWHVSPRANRARAWWLCNGPFGPFLGGCGELCAEKGRLSLSWPPPRRAAGPD